MNTRRAGFTLVELLVVAVLAAILMGAAYQMLVTQERSFRATSQVIRGQDALRMSLGVLEAELREVVTRDDATGGGDILAATRDSVVFRAQRKLGFVCAVSANDKFAYTLSLGPGGAFTVGDQLVIFADGNPASADDDEWVGARVQGLQTSSATCTTLPGSPIANQRLTLRRPDDSELPPQVLLAVRRGAPLRSLERVTYGLYADANGWYLGRRRHRDDTLERLVDGLAGPGSGLVFTYLNAAGTALTLPVSQGDMQNIAAVHIEATTSPPQGTGAQPAELSTRIHFRNN